MLEFLLALLTTATVGVLLVPLLRARVTRSDRFDGELAFHRDHLAETERSRAAGRTPQTEAAPLPLERPRVGRQPNDPDAQSSLGEALTLEADGTVTPAAVDAFNKALAAQPDDPRALYYLGLHEAQSGDSRAALKRWQELEAKSPPD